MSPALDNVITIMPHAIVNRNFNDFQSHPCSAKQQIEIAKRIELTEKVPRGRESLVMRPRKHFRATQCIFETLPQHKRKGRRKKFVTQNIEEPHCFLFHGIDEATAVNEFGFIPSHS